MFNTIDEVLTDLRAGKMVVVSENEGLSGEGAFVMAAEFVTPETITLMTRHGTGIITVPMSAKQFHALEFHKNTPTGFSVTVDARVGITVGSSNTDRALTIRKLADSQAQPQDFRWPGHVNALMARNGGVLKRPGYTEAAVDLMRLAELQLVCVICEIMDDRGEMLRVPELLEFARRFGYNVISITSLTNHRRKRERN